MNGFMIKTEEMGTGTPFIARLLFTILIFRDKISMSEAQKMIFDELYERFFDHAKLAYLSYIELQKIHRAYMAEVEEGTVVSIQKNTLLIKKEIDTEVRRVTYSILSEADIAYKEIINGYGKMFSAPDLGFMAQDDNKFKKGILGIREYNLTLANYLELNRKAWTGKLNAIRNKKEHGGWRLPEYQFKIINGKIIIIYPKIDGIEYILYLQFLLASLFTFAEELMVSTMNMLMAYEYVYEIPQTERRHDVAIRFDTCFVGSEYEPWTLKYKGPDMELVR